MSINPALIGKAGELLVAAELMRRGVDVAYPASDVGVDLLAYRLRKGTAAPTKTVPIQVKAASGSGFNFHRAWFERAPGLVLVSVWHVKTEPKFYIFGSELDVQNALGPDAVVTKSWRSDGIYTITKPNHEALARMVPHERQWNRILDQLPSD